MSAQQFFRPLPLVMCLMVGVGTVEGQTPPPRSDARTEKADTAGANAFQEWVRYFHALDGDKRIANVKPGVFFNDALKAYRFALEQQRPLLLVMVNRYSMASVRLVSSALPCPAIGRFAQHMVFAVTEPGDLPTYDVSGKVFADALGVRGYPTISVIAPNPDKIIELVRIEGFFPGDSLGNTLARKLAGEMSGLLSVEDARREFRESGLSLPGHPGADCTTTPFEGLWERFADPRELRAVLSELRARPR